MSEFIFLTRVSENWLTELVLQEVKVLVIIAAKKENLMLFRTWVICEYCWKIIYHWLKMVTISMFCWISEDIQSSARVGLLSTDLIGLYKFCLTFLLYLSHVGGVSLPLMCWNLFFVCACVVDQRNLLFTLDKQVFVLAYSGTNFLAISHFIQDNIQRHSFNYHFC